MKFKTIKKYKHYVFEDRAEFEDYFRNTEGVVPELILDWRDGKAQDWVLADDGGVVQILVKRELPHPHDRPNWKAHNGYCRTCVGTFIQNKNIFMDTDFEKHPDPWRFSGTLTNKEAHQNKKNRENLTKKELLFCANLVAGKTIQQSWDDSFGPSANWYEKAVFLLKRERVLKKVKEDVKSKLNEKFDGDAVDYIFDNLKELITLAKEQKNLNVLLSGLKELADWSGEKEKDQKIVTGQAQVTFEPFNPKELAKIEAEEVKVLTEATTD